MRHLTFWRLPAVALVGLLTAGLGCTGSVSDDGPTSGRQGPTAPEIIARMRAVYGDAETFVGNAEVVEFSVRRGEGVERLLPYYTMAIAYQRPNRISFVFEEAIETAEDGRCAVKSDGVITRASAGEMPGQIYEADAPLELSIENFIQEDQLRDVVMEVPPTNFFPHLVMLMESDKDAPLFPNDENPHRIESKELRGRNCYRVALDNANGKRVLWIDEEDFRLHRVELPANAERRSLDSQEMFADFAIRVEMLTSDFDVDLNPETFVMEVPAGARRVQKFVMPPSDGPPPHLGQQVSDFTLRTLEGKEIHRDDLAGKPALLDFWFMGCPPCRKQTPVVDEVYRELQDSDVQVFAVNTDSPRAANEEVATTLREWGGGMPILRVPERSDYESFFVELFPTMVLLDAEGRIQLFHEGPIRKADALLQPVRRVLAGDDLAAEARDAHEQRLRDFEAAVDEVAISESLVDVEVLGSQQP